MALVPFPRFLPDQSPFNPKASDLHLNVRPIKDGWGPMRDLSALGTALPAAPRGSKAYRSDNGTWQIFTGTAANLYRWSSSTYVPSEISVTTDGYNLADTVFWSFARYGNSIIATAVGSTYPQYVGLDTSDDFANLTNATFEAAIVAVVGDFLVFARIDGDNRTLRWSGVNDMTFWTNGQRGADQQELPDGGDIQAIIPQAGGALIIQERCIRRMVFDPSSGLTFRFEVLDPDKGAFASRSVVNLGTGDFVYFAKDGFYRGLQGIPIGAERVNDYIKAQCDSSKYHLISGVADPFDKVVHFRYEDSNGTNHLLSYDWQLDEWFPTEIDAVDLFEAATVGYSLEDLDDFGNIDTLPFSLDSPFWKGGIPGFAGFTSDYKIGFFDGAHLEAIIPTEHKALNYPRRAVTGRITVIADTDDAQVAIASKETQAGALTFGSYLSRQSGLPFINSRVSGRWHQCKVRIPSGTEWSNASGIDIEFTDGGFR